MKIKAGKPRYSFDAGAHAVFIHDIVPVLDSSKTLVKNKNGDYGVDIIFANESNRKISFRYWKSHSNKWIMQNLCRALGFEYSGAVDRKVLIGKRLFILVAREYIRINGTRKKDFDNKDVYTCVVLPDFRMLITQEMPPEIPGMPKSIDDEPSGIFARERDKVEPVDMDWINYPHQKDLADGF